MNTHNYKFGTFAWRIMAAHFITYFIAGILAFYLFNYADTFKQGDMAVLMKPTDSPWVMAGPLLQVFRGILFAVVLWPFRAIFLEGGYGWLKLWGLFLGLAILGTCGPAPGSFEGIIYTNFPVLDQIFGLREVVAQTLAFSLMLYYWYMYPKKIWDIITAIIVTVVSLMIIAGWIMLYA